jgi:hypothetical protein
MWTILRSWRAVLWLSSRAPQARRSYGPRLHWMLGIEIRRDRAGGTVHLLQLSYIDSILCCYGFNDVKPISAARSPATPPSMEAPCRGLRRNSRSVCFQPRRRVRGGDAWDEGPTMASESAPRGLRATHGRDDVVLRQPVGYHIYARPPVPRAHEAHQCATTSFAGWWRTARCTLFIARQRIRLPTRSPKRSPRRRLSTRRVPRTPRGLRGTRAMLLVYRLSRVTCSLLLGCPGYSPQISRLFHCCSD